MAVPYAEVIGDPVAHSKSPLIHKFWLEKLGMEGDYRAVRVQPGELADYLNRRKADADWRGCNVTLPHKHEVMKYLANIEGLRIGAVNCVVPHDSGLRGFNTDIEGIAEAVGKFDSGAPVAVIGAGGAARAAAASLGASHRLHIVVRNRAKAQAMLEDFDLSGAIYGLDQADEACAGCAGLINATPFGMDGFPEMPASLLSALSGVDRRGFAFDMVYNPLQTAFLDKAEGIGLRTIDGLSMLVGQAAGSFAAFFGREPPRAQDDELRAALTA